MMSVRESNYTSVSSGKNVPPGPMSNAELTLITPSHVVAATHHVGVWPGLATRSTVPRETSQEVAFYDPEGNRVTRTIVRYLDIGFDLTVAQLSEPVPRRIKVYKVLPPRRANGEPIDWATLLPETRTLNTVRERECLLYKVHSAGTLNSPSVAYGVNHEVIMAYRSERSLVDDRFIKGDSGNPQFIFVRGEPILLGILNNSLPTLPGLGRFFSKPEVFTALNAALKSLGGEESLKTISLF